ncbi:MAG: DUF3298 domain-containing protein [Clostridia bacterium]|nr:DUF3298 domain-containing protein [Clostridia bacterium]
MDKINRMKEEYNEIKAPQSMYKAMGELIAKRARWRMMINRAVKTAAMLVLVFAISLNMLPDTAKAMMDVPVLGGIVKVFTLGRYTSSENGKEIDVVTPQFGGMIDEDMQEELNKKFRENAKILIEAAENNAEEGFRGTYADYEVKTDNENILAVDLYVENVEGSASVTHDFYTIDKKAGKVIEFNSLFRDGTDFVAVIDEYITVEMERVNAESPDTFDIGENGFETIGNEPKFYISESGNIVICFDEYEVASGSTGSPEFEIPNEIVKDILK